jgi:hypothetical protein
MRSIHVKIMSLPSDKRTARGPTHGVTRGAAMAAFAKSWRRE